MPPITPFLEAQLKLVRTGCNLTPGNGVGSSRSFRIPTQKLMVVKPRCHLVTWLMSRISPNVTPDKDFRLPPSFMLSVANLCCHNNSPAIGTEYFHWLIIFLSANENNASRAAVNKIQDGDGG